MKMHFQLYRFNPDVDKKKPYMQDYHVELEDSDKKSCWTRWCA